MNVLVRELLVAPSDFNSQFSRETWSLSSSILQNSFLYSVTVRYFRLFHDTW